MENVKANSLGGKFEIKWRYIRTIMTSLGLGFVLTAVMLISVFIASIGTSFAFNAPI